MVIRITQVDTAVRVLELESRIELNGTRFQRPVHYAKRKPEELFIFCETSKDVCIIESIINES